jgi:nucleoside-diphosphate-sugar epimerase
VVYGPRDTDVYEVLRTAARGLLLRLGGEERFFSILYVTDLVHGLMLAANSPLADGNTYFLAGETAVSWTEFGATAASALDRSCMTVSIPAWAGYMLGSLAEIGSRVSKKPGILSREKVTEARQRYWVCDTSRAQADLGFSATTTLRDGMAATIQWYREAKWLKPVV